MKIKSLSYRPFEVTFKTPLITSRGVFTSRRGFLITAQSDKGVLGVGEVAPFTEFGTETLDAAEKELQRLCGLTNFPKWPEGLETLDKCMQKLKLDTAKTPATRIGIESALLAGFCREQEIRLEQLLCQDVVERVPVNALLSGQTGDEILASALQARQEGYRTFKLKIGMRKVEDDIDLLRSVRQRYPEHNLRADANGAWTLEQALQFFDLAPKLRLEYVEDPLPRDHLSDLKTLRKQTRIPIAIDEGARSANDVDILLLENLCEVLVIKPMAIGSYQILENIAFNFNAERVVISSLMESGVGLSYIAVCAAAYGSVKAAHGVGTTSHLTNDTLREPLIPERGRMTVPDVTMLPELLT
jgi:o-succinylbenzoate synthase